ncbi:hypothetical protein OOZ15_19300 [Galbibacter sp. EGI 63066]|uniref:hypothetical protein n=1 Tax=Galbibacter sp. EGI 63066 TaxID=2993559 RepID=UPI002248D1FF|nr:hypothetical protein [Galbibacter sp. EGI 63066]MCX2682105.1 hypothetical protein [Galbibacter sp. EGI 63066]
MKEIFQKLALKLIDDIGNVYWRKGVLDIMRLEGTVRFSAVYFDKNDNAQNVEVNFGFWESRLVHKLYDTTQNVPPIHANWNRVYLGSRTTR